MLCVRKEVEVGRCAVDRGSPLLQAKPAPLGGQGRGARDGLAREPEVTLRLPSIVLLVQQNKNPQPIPLE